MNKLVGVLPVIYVVIWFYQLITWFIPLLSTPFGKLDWAGLSIWGILAPMLFITLGSIILVSCIAAVVLVIIE
jgi:hypothetical protein